MNENGPRQQLHKTSNVCRDVSGGPNTYPTYAAFRCVRRKRLMAHNITPIPFTRGRHVIILE